MNKKKVKISHWKTQLDTTKDTLIRINIQKTKQTKNMDNQSSLGFANLF